MPLPKFYKNIGSYTTGFLFLLIVIDLTNRFFQLSATFFAMIELIAVAIFSVVFILAYTEKFWRKNRIKNYQGQEFKKFPKMSDERKIQAILAVYAYIFDDYPPQHELIEFLEKHTESFGKKYDDIIKDYEGWNKQDLCKEVFDTASSQLTDEETEILKDNIVYFYGLLDRSQQTNIKDKVRESFSFF